MAIKVESAKASIEDLALLGIDATKRPTGSRYPKIYNPKCHKIWQRIIDTFEFTEDTTQDWLDCTRALLRESRVCGLDPFDKDKMASTNNLIDDWLSFNRVQAIAFCNKIDLFKSLAIKSVKRTATVNEKNFTVSSTATTKVITDPTVQGWLTSAPIPGFVNVDGSRFEKQINAATTVRINFIGNTAEVCLSIFCHSIPLILSSKSSVSRSKLAKHIEKNVWTPLIKKKKFKGTSNKLF